MPKKKRWGRVRRRETIWNPSLYFWIACSSSTCENTEAALEMESQYCVNQLLIPQGSHTGGSAVIRRLIPRWWATQKRYALNLAESFILARQMESQNDIT